MFIGLLTVCTIESFGESLVSNPKGPINFLTLNNRPRPARTSLVNINFYKILFYQFTVRVNKRGGSCKTTDDPYARACVPNKVKKMKVNVFNLMSHETKFLVQHESCDCKRGLNESLCNSKQKWDYKECRCECKELDDWGLCEKDYILNPSTCYYKCNKACKNYEY